MFGKLLITINHFRNIYVIFVRGAALATMTHQAVAMYENALNLDPRHYNAWCGHPVASVADAAEPGVGFPDHQDPASFHGN